jgi:hypothetical protein
MYCFHCQGSITNISLLIMLREIIAVQSCLLGYILPCNPEDNSEHHTRRRENLKSHEIIAVYYITHRYIL